MSVGSGQYKICASYHGNLHKDLMMGIKINSDNMDEPKLSSAIKNEDVAPLNEKVKNILNVGNVLIKWQENDLDNEDIIAAQQMSSSRNYYILTVFQIIVIVALGLYQIFSFRKFLSFNNVI